MKIKEWLIRKLGGITQNELYELYNQQRNIIRYQEGHVITYKTELIINKDWPFAVERAQNKLATQMLDAVKENMEIEYMDCPETGMIKYKAILRLVKVE